MTRATPAARRRIVEQWRKSPLSGQEFALSRGVSLSTLYHWRREMDARAGFVELVADEPGARSSATSSAAERVLPDPAFTPAVEIATPTGLVVRIAAAADESLLRRRVLGQIGRLYEIEGGIKDNACERSLRAVAIGRENWLFAGSQFGGETAAAWFSVIASARLHEVEPWAYLTDVLTRLPLLGPDPADADLEPLLPDRWIAEHPHARLALNR